MAKRRRTWDKDKIERRIAEGYGQGRGDAYQPWLHIQDVPSEGNVWRIKGITHDRIYHCLSEEEQRYCTVLDLACLVTEIREGYPLLPQEETLEIADECGFEHPTDPTTGYPIVITTDFLVNVGLDEFPRTYKPANKLEDLNAIEHLEIERRWWERHGKPLKIVTQHDVPPVLVANAMWLHPTYRLDRYPRMGITASRVRHIATALTDRVGREDALLCDIALACDEDLGVSPGSSLLVARHLMATGQWAVDMYTPLGGEQRLSLLNVNLARTA